MESLIANGKPLPLTKNAIVDREQALNLIDELRVAVPEEVRAAKRINSEGERIIEKAQEEAERIVARAQEQAAFLIGERGLTEAAEAESRRIIIEAEDDGENIRRGADEYAAGVLAALQAEVGRTLAGIDRGIALLEDRRAAYAPQPEPEPEPMPRYADRGDDGLRYDESDYATPRDDDDDAHADDEGLGNLARR
ncbi:MAG: hypothetical protein U0838_08845 [Chloroflexota bacterium]